MEEYRAQLEALYLNCSDVIEVEESRKKLILLIGNFGGDNYEKEKL